MWILFFFCITRGRAVGVVQKNNNNKTSSSVLVPCRLLFDRRCLQSNIAYVKRLEEAKELLVLCVRTVSQAEAGIAQSKGCLCVLLQSLIIHSQLHCRWTERMAWCPRWKYFLAEGSEWLSQTAFSYAWWQGATTLRDWSAFLAFILTLCLCLSVCFVVSVLSSLSSGLSLYLLEDKNE